MALKLPPPPPAPAKKGTGHKPLGVPEDYIVNRPLDPSNIVDAVRGDVAPVTGAPLTFAQPPRYFTGDDLLPATLSPEKIALLQRDLVNAGLIGPKTKFRLGVWDDASRSAFRNLLEYANASGLDQKQALQRYGQAEQMGGAGSDGAGSTRQPLVTKVTNPDDLRAVADTVARAKLGRKLAPDEVDRFVKAFQGREAGAQAAYNADPTGGTVTDAPNPQAFLAQRIAKDYGVEAGAHDLAEQGNQFLDILHQVGG